MVGLSFFLLSLGSLTLKSERDVAPLSGLMANYMRGGLKTTKHTVRGERSMQTDISMMAIGRMVCLMDLASTLI